VCVLGLMPGKGFHPSPVVLFLYCMVGLARCGYLQCLQSMILWVSEQERSTSNCYTLWKILDCEIMHVCVFFFLDASISCFKAIHNVIYLSVPPALFTLPGRTTVVCRCEDQVRLPAGIWFVGQFFSYFPGVRLYRHAFCSHQPLSHHV
jgi:hypothetical protein